MDQICMAQISLALLRGMTSDAEKLVDHLFDPEHGVKRINDWKARWAGVPHGQWAG